MSDRERQGILTSFRSRGISRKIKILSLLLTVLSIGIIYEQIEEHLDSTTYRPVGQLVSINGHDMHIWGKGSGRVTVVFASGWGVPSPYVDFYPLYNEISKHTRAVVYDRPGYGWSDTSDTPRDIDTITQEIHELLEKSGEKPPYILCGHSIGSLEMLRFAQKYRSEVNGLVLIDGSNPEMYSTTEKASVFVSLRASVFKRFIYLLNKSGISRLLLNTIPNFYSLTVLSTARNNLSSVSDNFKKLDAAMFLKTFRNRNHIEEGRNKEMNAFKVASGGYINDIPLLIFTSEMLNKYENHRRYQSDFKKWSTASRQIIVKGSGHAVHWYYPEIINETILKLLE